MTETDIVTMSQHALTEIERMFGSPGSSGTFYSLEAYPVPSKTTPLLEEGRVVSVEMTAASFCFVVTVRRSRGPALVLRASGPTHHAAALSVIQVAADARRTLDVTHRDFET